MKLKIYLWKLFSQKWRLLNFLVLMVFSGLLSLSAVSGVLGQGTPSQTNLVYSSEKVKPGDEFTIGVKIPDGTSLEKDSPVSADINLGQLSKKVKIINLDTDNGNYLIGSNKDDKVVGAFSISENGHFIFAGRVKEGITRVSGGQVLFKIPMKSKEQIDFSRSKNQLSMSSLNTVSQDPVTGKSQTKSLLGADMNSQGNGSGGSAGNGGGNNDINGGGSTAGSGSSGGLPQYGPDSFYALICQITCFLRPIIITLAILMIILSGFQFVTARGNEEKINQAKNTFKWTVIGVAIVIGADLIIKILAEILSGESTSCNCS